MLQIREEQLAALSRLKLEQFEERMAAHLRGRFDAPTKGMTDAKLRRLIREGMQRARTYGVTSERDVRRFHECQVVHGPGFDSDAKTRWAGEILHNQKFNGTQKMDRIADYELFVLKATV